MSAKLKSVITHPFNIIEGSSIEVKSQYYKQLNKYCRQIIRAINKPCNEKDLSYYLSQLELSKKEMKYVQDKFFSMFVAAVPKDEAMVLIAKKITDY